MDANLDWLQQLPAEEVALVSQCTITCWYSCLTTGPIGPCDITTTIS